MVLVQEQEGDKTLIPREKALEIRAVVCGVDGVLTDGRIGYMSNRCEIHFFDARDGLAIRLASWFGLKIAWITGRLCNQVSQRATDLEVPFYPGFANKEVGLRMIARDLELNLREIAYIGDDLNDLLAFRIAGFPIAVGNAPEEVKAEAAHVTRARGGDGVAREVIETILRSQGHWEKAVDNYLATLVEPERIRKYPRTEE